MSKVSRKPIHKDYQNPKYPTGWYVIAESKEIAPGQILSRTFSGKELIIFRTQKGESAVLDAYCPHLGAHFAHGGTVEGEHIKCPFHGFCFDTKGSCVKTGYATKPSPLVHNEAWPVYEAHGLIFCYFHPEKKAFDYELDFKDDPNFTHYKIHTWKLHSNPVEIAENSVDIGHFSHVHGYRDPHVIKPLELNGPLLNTKYGMYRKGDFIGKPKKYFLVEFEIFQQGLGFALVEASIKELGIVTRHLVMTTAIAKDEVYLRIACSIKKIERPQTIMPILKFFPKKWLTHIMHTQAFKGYIKDVHLDFKVWKNKIYISNPPLSKGDGPIMRFRNWATQFNNEHS